MSEALYAGGFFYNPKTRRVLLHKRDGHTSVNPHKWAFFGGAGESGESPVETFVREIKEELDVALKQDEVIPLCDYFNKESGTHRYVFFVESELAKSAMMLGEGADFDWVSLDRAFKLDLTDKTARDLRVFSDRVVKP